MKQLYIGFSFAAFSFFSISGVTYSTNSPKMLSHTTISENNAVYSDIPFTDFKDDIGSKGETESRNVYKTRAAYFSYFGHNPPEVDFSQFWVVFYSAGVKNKSGYTSSIRSIRLSNRGTTLLITTRLTSPGKYCKPLKKGTKPYILAKFRRPSPAPTYIQFYKNDILIDCKQ